MLRTLTISLSLLSLASLAGCHASATAGNAAAPAAQPTEPAFFNGATAGPATLAEIISAASAADAVIIGENHGHPLGLSTAAAIWKGVLDQSPSQARAALSLEFFERDVQSHLDDYLTGVTDDAAFRKATGRTDSNYPPGHRAMVELAKERNCPVIAANAPRPYVRLARTTGYDRLRSLTPEQRRLFRIPDELPTGRYRDDFDKVMNENAKVTAIDDARRAALDAGFRSQSMWDWTMAESITRALADGRSPVVQVIGRFHCDFEGGTVQAVKKLRPGTRTLTISFVDAWSSTLRESDKARADFVIYVGPDPAAAR